MTFIDRLKQWEGKLVFAFTQDSHIIDDDKGRYTSAVGGRLAGVHEDFLEIVHKDGLVRIVPVHAITTVQEMKTSDAISEGFEDEALNKMAGGI